MNDPELGSNMYEVHSKEDLDKLLCEADKEIVIILEFYDVDCEACVFIDEILKSFARLYENEILVLRINVHEFEETVEEYKITKVPTLIFVRDQNQLDRFTSDSLNKLRRTIVEHCGPPKDIRMSREGRTNVTYSAAPGSRPLRAGFNVPEPFFSAETTYSKAINSSKVNDDPELLDDPLVPHVYKIYSQDDLEKLLSQADKDIVIVMEFSAEWCYPCKFIGVTLEFWAKLYEGKMIVVKVDVDNLKAIADEYNITSVPTFIFMREREELDRFTGSNLNKLRDSIKQHCVWSNLNQQRSSTDAECLLKPKFFNGSVILNKQKLSGPDSTTQLWPLNQPPGLLPQTSFSKSKLRSSTRSAATTRQSGSIRQNKTFSKLEPSFSTRQSVSPGQPVSIRLEPFSELEPRTSTKSSAPIQQLPSMPYSASIRQKRSFSKLEPSFSTRQSVSHGQRYSSELEPRTSRRSSALIQQSPSMLHSASIPHRSFPKFEPTTSIRTSVSTRQSVSPGQPVLLRRRCCCKRGPRTSRRSSAPIEHSPLMQESASVRQRASYFELKPSTRSRAPIQQAVSLRHISFPQLEPGFSIQSLTSARQSVSPQPLAPLQHTYFSQLDPRSSIRSSALIRRSTSIRYPTLTTQPHSSQESLPKDYTISIRSCSIQPTNSFKQSTSTRP